MKMKTIFITLLSALFLTACSTVNTVERANSQAQPQMINDKRIITDSGLDDYAYVAAVNKSVVGGLLKIQLKVVNRTVALRAFNYKFSWFDKEGMEVSQNSATWIPITLEGGETRYISAVAPSLNAYDFTVKFLADVRQ